VFKFPINLEFVLLAAVINMVLGFLWYGPIFGNLWEKLMKLNGKKLIKDTKGVNLAQTYFVTFSMSLLTYYILANMINYTSASTYLQGMHTGFWLWLGFVAPAQFMEVLYSSKSPKLFALDSGYQLLALLINGAILARWV
jgi:hypothetical protein